MKEKVKVKDKNNGKCKGQEARVNDMDKGSGQWQDRTEKVNKKMERTREGEGGIDSGRRREKGKGEGARPR